MTDEEEIRYSYRMRGWAVLYFTFVCVLLGGVWVFLAVTEGDEFFGVHVGAPYSALAYGLCAAVTFWLGFFLIRMYKMQNKSERAIVMGPTEVVLPKALALEEIVHVPYNTIQDLDMDKASRAALSFIRIDHDGGHTRISDMGFENRADFIAVYDVLREKISAVKREAE
ncbi:MAG: hypothetical protein HWE34_11950 [Methylocystaceae bacterium]|nr:hypothetical protein [Methylocystaceae bacterium]